MMMKEFFNRNKPTLMIGLMTFLVFIILIIISLATRKSNGELVKIDDDNVPYIVSPEEPKPEANYIEKPEDLVSSDTSPNMESISSASEIASLLRQGYKPLKVSYYEEKGFSPKYISAMKGQTIVWTNKTDHDIYLKQKMPVYEELNSPVLIKSGETFEFTLYEEGVWTYEELNTKKFGSVDIPRSSLIP